MMHYEIPPVLRFNDLKKLFKVSRSSLDRWEKTGDFPKRFSLGKNSVGWNSKAVQEWLSQRAKTQEVIK